MLNVKDEKFGEAMARSGVLYSEVAEAISALQGENKKITIEAIRHYLGTGSNSTLARHLSTWKQQTNSNLMAQGGHLPKEVLAFAQGLWQRLNEEVSQQISEYQSQADQKILIAEQEVKTVHTTLAELREKLHHYEEQVARSQQQEKQVQLLLTEEQKNNCKLAERVSYFEKHIEMEKSEKNKWVELSKQTQANLEHYQQEALNLREKQNLIVEQQRQGYQQNLDGLQEKLRYEMQQRSQFEANLKQAEKNVLQFENQIFELTIEIKKLQTEMQPLQINLQTLTKEHENLEHQYNLASTTLNLNMQEIIKYTAEAIASKDKIKLLEKELNDARDKIQILRQDNLFLAEEKANLAGQFQQLEKALRGEKQKGVSVLEESGS